TGRTGRRSVGTRRRPRWSTSTGATSPRPDRRWPAPCRRGAGSSPRSRCGPCSAGTRRRASRIWSPQVWHRARWPPVAGGSGMSSQDAGFPPGITAGDLGRRVVAYVIDAALPVVLSAGAVTAVALVPRLDLRIVLGIVAGLLSLGWLVVLWWSQGTRGASPGMKLMKLEVVAVENGRPVGWGRAIIRSLVLLG